MTASAPLKRILTKAVVALSVAAAIACAQTETLQAKAQTQKPSPPTAMPKTVAELDALATKVSNWGRWGANDQLGTINLITPKKRVQAAALVKSGESVSLSLDLQKGRPGDANASYAHVLTIPPQNTDVFAFDQYTISEHGWAVSHIDAPSHIFRNGKLYNGYPVSEVAPTVEGKTLGGANVLAISNLRDGIFTRGLIVDIPRMKGVPYLEPGAAITVADLEAWEKWSGLRISSGDVLLIRTGRWARQKAKGDPGFTLAGLNIPAAVWLHARDIAALGSDGVSDVVPSGVEGLTFPVHLLMLHAMGTPLLDNLDLDAAAEKAAALRRSEALFTAAPLRLTGGTGAPINATVTF